MLRSDIVLVHSTAWLPTLLRVPTVNFFNFEPVILGLWLMFAPQKNVAPAIRGNSSAENLIAKSAEITGGGT